MQTIPRAQTRLTTGSGKPKGFTLIELLVVIAIIGLLATLAVVQFGAARSKARDAKRKADVSAIQKALELYYSANNQYPPSGGAIAPNNGWTNSNDASWAGLTTNLTPFLANLPKDPTNDGPGWAGDGTHFTYTFFSTGYGCTQQWYMIVYRLENMAGIVSPGVTACNGTNFNYGGTMTVGKRAE